MLPYINILGRQIPMYGIMMALGVGAAFLLMGYTAKSWGQKKNDVFYGALYAIIGALIGAKLLYVIVDFETVLKNPLAFLTGGAVFYGGVIGGAVGGWIYTRRYKLSLVRMLDTVSPCITLGHAFGRVGCFFGGCCYGRETESLFGVVYPEGGYAPSGVKLLPTQLFESAFLLVLTVVLLIILKKTKKSGGTGGWYLILYGVWRIFIEFFRSDPRGSVFALSTSQFISIFMIAAGILLLVFGERLAAKEDCREDWNAEQQGRADGPSKESK